jgi:cytochrome c oxidase cbb3-type subunit 3
MEQRRAAPRTARAPRLASTILAGLAFVLGAHAEAGRPTPAERLFQQECAVCHGPHGEGDRGPALAVPRLARVADRAGLMKVLRNGIEGTEMPAARLEAGELELLATWVERLGRRPVEAVPGDVLRGRALYAGKGGCPACHTIEGRGGALGPDLTDIAARRGAAYLRASLLTPEAALPRGFMPYRTDVSLTQNFLQVRVTTSAGRELTGVRVNEDTFSIQLRDATNAVFSFWKAELRELHKDWGKSPMPSYTDAFDRQELEDVVAYLASLRPGGAK